MLAVVVDAGWDAVDVVDWVKAGADKLKMDAIRTRNRDENHTDDAMVKIRDG